MNREIQVVQRANFIATPKVLVDLGQVFGLNRFVIECRLMII